MLRIKSWVEVVKNKGKQDEITARNEEGEYKQRTHEEIRVDKYRYAAFRVQ